MSRSPFDGSARWALAHTRRRLTTFTWGTVGLTLIGAALSAWASSATTARRPLVIRAVVAAALTILTVAFVAAVVAFIRAPYEQRDALRMRFNPDAISGTFRLRDVQCTVEYADPSRSLALAAGEPNVAMLRVLLVFANAGDVAIRYRMTDFRFGAASVSRSLDPNKATWEVVEPGGTAQWRLHDPLPLPTNSPQVQVDVEYALMYEAVTGGVRIRHEQDVVVKIARSVGSQQFDRSEWDTLSSDVRVVEP